RDSKVDQQAFTCGRLPSWFPLGQEGIVIFDEMENPNRPPGCQISPCTSTSQIPFPLETQRTEVGGADLPSPFDFGWLYLNLNTTVATAGNNPPEDPAAAQAYVIAEYEANGHFAAGVDAVKLDSACTANHFVP